MFSVQLKFLIIFILLSSVIPSQSNSKYQPDKPGKWSVSSNLQSFFKGEKIIFENNLTFLAEWFHKNIPVLTNPRGFDLETTFYGIWDDNYKKQECNYAYRSEIDFAFQLFFKEKGKETKWTIEPPHYEVDINNTETGHGSNLNQAGYIAQTDDPSIEEPLENACAELSDFFQVFPLVKKMAPGVNLYGDGNLIIFNPNRPAFWVQVTVKEVIEKLLDYYKIKEANKPSVYNYVKDVYEKMPPDELNLPAYYGGDAIVDITADSTGALQIMRFNKDYWDRSLPKSAIQFISLWYRPSNEFDMDEFINDNDYPHYGQLLMNELPFSTLSSLIQRK